MEGKVEKEERAETAHQGARLRRAVQRDEESRKLPVHGFFRACRRPGGKRAACLFHPRDLAPQDLLQPQHFLSQDAVLDSLQKIQEGLSFLSGKRLGRAAGARAARAARTIGRGGDARAVRSRHGEKHSVEVGPEMRKVVIETAHLGVAQDIRGHEILQPMRDPQAPRGMDEKPAVRVVETVAHALHHVNDGVRLSLEKVEGRVLRHEGDVM